MQPKSLLFVFFAGLSAAQYAYRTGAQPAVKEDGLLPSLPDISILSPELPRRQYAYNKKAQSGPENGFLPPIPALPLPDIPGPEPELPKRQYADNKEAKPAPEDGLLPPLPTIPFSGPGLPRHEVPKPDGPGGPSQPLPANPGPGPAAPPNPAPNPEIV